METCFPQLQRLLQKAVSKCVRASQTGRKETSKEAVETALGEEN